MERLQISLQSFGTHLQFEDHMVLFKIATDQPFFSGLPWMCHLTTIISHTSCGRVVIYVFSPIATP